MRKHYTRLNIYVGNKHASLLSEGIFTIVKCFLVKVQLEGEDDVGVKYFLKVRGQIHKPLFSLQLTNGPNKLESLSLTSIYNTV